MNNVVGVLLAISLLLSGCVATQETAIMKQELIKVSSLPQLVSTGFMKEAKVGVLFRVLSDGTIAEVRILKSGADRQWDSMAVDVMKQWRFSAVPYDSVVEGHWIHFLFNIRIEEPLSVTLGEIVVSEQHDADSLWALLKHGVPFGALTEHVAVGSPSERARYLGPVDIAVFPERVRNELRKLDVDDFTRPIRLGNNFVIYVRLEQDTSRNLLQ